jgi:hypothetical protein
LRRKSRETFSCQIQNPLVTALSQVWSLVVGKKGLAAKSDIYDVM